MMDIPTLIQAIVGLALTFAIYLVTAYLKAKTATIKDEQARKLAETVVLAVEQTIKNLHGQSKYQIAESELREFLRKRGITIDDEVIKALIEAAVAKMNSEKPVSAPT